MTLALTRAVPASINECELTFHARTPIDVGLARTQHTAYQQVLTGLGCEVFELPEMPELADSVFVEDTALVFDECAIITRPGAASRRAEIPSIREALSRYRTLHEIAAPATLDGGDVLRIGRRVYAGISTRTSPDATEQLRNFLKPLGYDVIAVAVNGALHLKTAVSVVADDLIVVDPTAIDPSVFSTRFIEVPANAANMLRVNGVVLCPAVAADTAARLEREGVTVRLVDNSELAKAEAGLTCCSLVFSA
jgi:dimethylargininase